MRKYLLVVAVGLMSLPLAEVASAEPTLHPRLQGSGFFVSTNNSEDVGYNCNLDYTIYYKDFGNDGKRTFHQTTYVEPRKNGDVLSYPTPWAADSLRYDFKYSCYRESAASPKAAAPPTAPASRPLYRRPFGTYRETCTSCRVHGSILSCKCDGKDTSLDIRSCGSLDKICNDTSLTSLDSPSCGSGIDQICNRNGELRCPGRC